jgi:hypothetical protein
MLKAISGVSVRSVVAPFSATIPLERPKPELIVRRFGIVLGETAEPFVVSDCDDPNRRWLPLFGLAFGLPIVINLL